eukprot:scaffold324202_cov52-Tisochrysis_lutea.AAC.1
MQRGERGGLHLPARRERNRVGGGERDTQRERFAEQRGGRGGRERTARAGREDGHVSRRRIHGSPLLGVTTIHSSPLLGVTTTL